MPDPARSPIVSRDRPRRGRVTASALLVACALLALAGHARAAGPEGIHKIQHVVVIMQENRSFDQYFGTYPGANGIPAGVCLPDPVLGGCRRPYHDSSPNSSGGPHGTTSSINDISGGQMNGFVATAEEALNCNTTNPACTPCKGARTVRAKAKCLDVMGYRDAREIPNYWAYANNFVLQDNMFEPVASWSLPAHLFMVSGWSAVCPHENTNPLECSASINPVVPARSWSAPVEPKKATYAWTDITYQLAKANVSWRYYVFAGDEPDCRIDEELSCSRVIQDYKTPGIWNPLPAFVDVKQDRQQSNIVPFKNFAKEVSRTGSCGLANVSWLTPSQQVGEHPPGSFGLGQAYVTTVINQIMRSPCWSSTAIFLSWDDWGGFYDHVVPPAIDQLGYGLRVPGLVISPYAKAGYIDHQQLSHDAYLKFIQDDFLGGARLNPATDGRPDRRAVVREEAPGLGNLANAFNFRQALRSPLLLPTKPPPGPASEPPGGIPNPPEVRTLHATARPALVTLRGEVNPNEGLVSDCHFEYGATASYGTSVACSTLPGAGESPVPVEAEVASLAPGPYHFRLVATNKGGTSFGADRTFNARAARVRPVAPAGPAPSPPVAPAAPAPSPPGGTGTGLPRRPIGAPGHR
jgi:phospholipase C